MFAHIHSPPAQHSGQRESVRMRECLLEAAEWPPASGINLPRKGDRHRSRSSSSAQHWRAPPRLSCASANAPSFIERVLWRDQIRRGTI